MTVLREQYSAHWKDIGAHSFKDLALHSLPLQLRPSTGLACTIDEKEGYLIRLTNSK